MCQSVWHAYIPIPGPTSLFLAPVPLLSWRQHCPGVGQVAPSTSPSLGPVWEMGMGPETEKWLLYGVSSPGHGSGLGLWPGAILLLCPHYWKHNGVGCKRPHVVSSEHPELPVPVDEGESKIPAGASGHLPSQKLPPASGTVRGLQGHKL